MSTRRIVLTLVLLAVIGGVWKLRGRFELQNDPEKQLQIKVTGACSGGVLVTAENRNEADVLRMSVRTRMVNAETESASGDETRREWTKRVPANGTATECWIFHSRVRPGEEPAYDFEAISVELEK